MILLHKDMEQIRPRFAAAGLTAKLIRSNEPSLEDDQIEIFRGDVDTRVYIQICLIGGGFCVSEGRGEDMALVITSHGEFRTLRKAVDRAIQVVSDLARRCRS